jgi:diadenosine tetraphosphatase ApaH/serine/threonine PP2A family protein phosphatase
MIEFSPAPAHMPSGRRVYAIGDIHGCASQLKNLHASIAEDLARRPIASALLLHVGDYVDRGADTRGVIAHLIGAPPVPGAEMVNLMGNHENTMIEALNGERAAATDWLFTGGRPTLQSYGADPDGPRTEWRGYVPDSHVHFLRDLRLMHREGGYAFVHAGVRPGVALEAQARDDLLRMRQPFLYSEQDFGAVVVHGHSPVKAPVIRHNRIAIDTGAVYGGDMTCLVLEDDRLGFLTAPPVGEPVSIAHR